MGRGGDKGPLNPPGAHWMLDAYVQGGATGVGPRVCPAWEAPNPLVLFPGLARGLCSAPGGVPGGVPATAQFVYT